MKPLQSPTNARLPSWAGLTPAKGAARRPATREWALDLLAVAAGPPPFPGEQAAGDSHLSGFLESGHTRNCSSAGWKVRGSSALSLRSAKDLAPGASRYLPATADGARGPRSTGVSLQHAVTSMTAPNSNAARFPRTDPPGHPGQALPPLRSAECSPSTASAAAVVPGAGLTFRGQWLRPRFYETVNQTTAHSGVQLFCKANHRCQGPDSGHTVLGFHSRGYLQSLQAQAYCVRSNSLFNVNPFSVSVPIQKFKNLKRMALFSYKSF